VPDVYATITEADAELQKRLADVIELRFADPQHQSMLRSYLSEISFPRGARVLEIGCGTGAVSRTLAEWPGVSVVTGLDPSPVFLARARQLAASLTNVVFDEGDARQLRYDANSYDVVIAHTALCHIPQPEQVLREVFRVLRRGGSLAVFDGDYATATVATGSHDPLESCIRAFRESFVNDSWLVRHLQRLLVGQGFQAQPLRSHGYVETPHAGYMLTWVDRGADVLTEDGVITREHADALKAEARRRSATRSWFGHIAFASIVARKPD
jgi:ubiquinone/menaquinone biosynthesis C-methylase UbiE